MPSLCCWCTKKNQHDIEDHQQTVTTWRDLLKSTGHNLWAIRHELQTRHSWKNDDGILVPIANKDAQQQKQAQCIKLLWQPSAFQRFEEDQVMDKTPLDDGFDGVATATTRIRRPLTRCTGNAWTKQRPIVCTALANVPKLSLEATKQVQWRSFLLETAAGPPLPYSTIQAVDLKQVVLEASELWNRQLFLGTNNEITNSTEYHSVLRKATLEYWKEVRAITKNKVSMQNAMLKLEEALPWNHFAQDGGNDNDWQYPPEVLNKEAKNRKGLLQSLYESGLQPQQATDNSVNALIASLDAVQALVFWTLWNLSRHNSNREASNWKLCESISHEQAQRDLLQISIFKKQATQGKTIALKEISFLAAALLETVRVYPPVWTLPRTWHNQGEAVACKFDVLLCNQATSRKWDPSLWLNQTGDNAGHSKIASFGLGERYCPAGTGGLYAAYELIRSFVVLCSKIEECQPDQVLNYSYLGPTLCTHGPQLFRVTLRDLEE